jgi:hypothetical protein
MIQNIQKLVNFLMGRNTPTSLAVLMGIGVTLALYQQLGGMK